MFSPDGTLISASAAPHCGVNMAMKSVKYWYKLVELSGNRRRKAAYENVNSLNDKGVEKWASDVRKCYSSRPYGFGIVWVSQVGDKTFFFTRVKQWFVACNAQDWHDNISTKERFENYRSFEQILQLESYLSYLTVIFLFIPLSMTLTICHSNIGQTICHSNIEQFWAKI